METKICYVFLLISLFSSFCLMKYACVDDACYERLDLAVKGNRTTASVPMRYVSRNLRFHISMPESEYNTGTGNQLLHLNIYDTNTTLKYTTNRLFRLVYKPDLHNDIKAVLMFIPTLFDLCHFSQRIEVTFTRLPTVHDALVEIVFEDPMFELYGVYLIPYSWGLHIESLYDVVWYSLFMTVLSSLGYVCIYKRE